MINGALNGQYKDIFFKLRVRMILVLLASLCSVGGSHFNKINISESCAVVNGVTAFLLFLKA